MENKKIAKDVLDIIYYAFATITANGDVGLTNLDIVDDLMATGGTAHAAQLLVERTGSSVAGFLFAIELEGQGGREKLSQKPVNVLMKI